MTVKRMAALSARTKRRLTVAVLVTVGVVTAAYVSAFAFMFLRTPVESYLYSVRFNSTAWRAHSMDHGLEWPTRLRMIDDLMRQNLLDGKSREEVVGVLGPPDRTAKFRDWDLVYDLGPERSFIRIDSEWLLLRMDTNGRVTAARVTHD